MTVALIPDMEKITSDYLRTYPALVSLSVRVVGKSPSNTDTPWIRVTEFDAISGHRSDRLIDYALQFDCYAGKTGGQPEVNSIARNVRKALKELGNTVTGGATINGVEVASGPREIDPDVDEPGRDRKILTATIWAHV